MKRGVAPMTISYKDQSATFEMPGWYCDECDESIHTGDDMKVSDRMLKRLKSPHNFAARDPRQLHEAAVSTWRIVTSAGSDKPSACTLSR